VDARERYDELVDDLCARNDDVEPAKMMGMPCVKRGGKMVAGFTQESMVFKLPGHLDGGERHAAALALEGAHLFDPSGKGQPFKEWVVVPVAHAELWEKYAEHALRPSS
jgi:hypothetical protein